MDATGGERLLGRTELSPLEVLIRETAQNSWDARKEGQTPVFGVNLRRADFRMREDLDVLLSERRRISPLQPRSLDSLFMLEIFDRGTSGLDGPVTLQPVDGDAPRNFQDLILKVGVPRDDGKGGGTYGFGKTASYAFSGRGTVLYWSRCRNDRGALEHRFIASAFRESYTDGGVQYTGRHWWARRVGDTMLPLRGDEAEKLASRFFQRRFERDETGTSMLIIEPRLSSESLGADIADHESSDDQAFATAATFTTQARSAIRRHLWPKLVPPPGDEHGPMTVSLVVDEQPIPLVDDALGAIELWGAGLNAIRALRMSDSHQIKTPQGIPILVVPVTRYRRVLGHLAIVRRLPALETRSGLDDLDPVKDSSISRIVLMRGQPELVVATVDWINESPLIGFDWLAVYKSADAWDAVYARTEPPAHDAWVASSGGDEGLVVKATRNRIVAAIREHIFPEPSPDSETGTEPVRTGSLSRRFAFMLPSPAPSPREVKLREGGRRISGRTATPRVDVASPALIATYADGRQRQSVGFTLDEDVKRALITIGVSAIGDEGVHESLEPGDLELEWTVAEPVGPSQAIVGGGRLASVQFTGLARRALRIDLTAKYELTADKGNSDADS